MTTWTRWLALPVAGLLLMAAGGHTQPPAPALPAPTDLSPPAGVAPKPPPAAPLAPSNVIPPQNLPATPPPAPTIDQLLDRLERLRQQKEELGRQERAVTEQLRDALRKQRERLGRLGVEEAPPPRSSIPTSVPEPAPTTLVPDTRRG